MNLDALRQPPDGLVPIPQEADQMAMDQDSVDDVPERT
jgi:hypothetical protein